MKLKRIKDNEVVVDGKQYAKFVRFNHDFWEMQGALYDGYNPYFYSVYNEDSGFYTVCMIIRGFITDIKRFNSDDAEYNRVCAKELVELLNQEQ